MLISKLDELKNWMERHEGKYEAGTDELFDLMKKLDRGIGKIHLSMDYLSIYDRDKGQIGCSTLKIEMDDIEKTKIFLIFEHLPDGGIRWNWGQYYQRNTLNSGKFERQK
jgi:hypothetical protein